ncbi:hypothetical protein PPL_07486 [Heterostelium album PN500]|uniref:Protein transport protein sec16 n=1 Tax=Heterostelium pallidum (strain ATCC 26659 / Pp 5 / PN500) TaxID=670386 RepID=D3BG35_HETP5|nr:hypothetical protein PPL_07486 [Heterostelium album PN500]EFA79627.1 hypothetical protein PPL_07486 [Heterostelium album PN500]|eukprot:XP_020431748.1 hypothetical protein PPL_07486 [Heterostelium album PN500]
MDNGFEVQFDGDNGESFFDSFSTPPQEPLAPAENAPTPPTPPQEQAQQPTQDSQHEVTTTSPQEPPQEPTQEPPQDLSVPTEEPPQQQQQQQNEQQLVEDLQQQIENLTIEQVESSPPPVQETTQSSQVDVEQVQQQQEQHQQEQQQHEQNEQTEIHTESQVQQQQQESEKNVEQPEQQQQNEIDNSIIDSMTVTSANSSQLDNSDVSNATSESFTSISNSVLSEDIPLVGDSGSKDSVTFLQETNSVSSNFEQDSIDSSQNSIPFSDTTEQFSTPSSTLPPATGDFFQQQQQQQPLATETTSQSSEKDCSSFFGDSASGNDDFSSFFTKPASPTIAAATTTTITSEPPAVVSQQQSVVAPAVVASQPPAPVQQQQQPAQPEKELSSFFGGDSGVGGGGNNFFGGGGGGNDDFGSSFFDTLIIQQEEEQRRKEQQELQRKQEEEQRRIQEEQHKLYLLEQQKQQQQAAQQQQWNGGYNNNQYGQQQQQYSGQQQQWNGYNNQYQQQPQPQQNQWGQPQQPQQQYPQASFFDQFSQQQQQPSAQQQQWSAYNNQYQQQQPPQPVPTNQYQPQPPAVNQYQPSVPVATNQYQPLQPQPLAQPPIATNQYQPASPVSHNISPPTTQQQPHQHQRQFSASTPQRSSEQVPYYQPSSPSTHTFNAQPPTHPQVQHLSGTTSPSHSPSSSYTQSSMPMPMPTPLQQQQQQPPAAHQYQVPSPSSSFSHSSYGNNSVTNNSNTATNHSNPGSVTSAASLSQSASGLPSYQPTHARTNSNEFSAMLKQQVGYTPSSPLQSQMQVATPQQPPLPVNPNSVPPSPSSYTPSLPMAIPSSNPGSLNASIPPPANLSGSYSQSPSQYPMASMQPQQNYYQQQQPSQPSMPIQYNQQQQQYQQSNQYYQQQGYQQGWGATPAVAKTDTPLFTRPHPVFTFGFGEPGWTIATLSQCIYFPGPLTNSTSKDTVNKWIQERIADIGSGRMDTLCSRDPEASHLLWELLVVLNNNEGQILDNEKNFDKTLHKLLLDNKNSMTNFPPQQLNRSDADLQILLNEMQNLLIRGDLVGAHKFTMDNQLWTHAIVLSHYLGPEAYGKTLLAFSNNSFPLGSPLKTVYSLYSNNTRELFKDLQGVNASPAFLESWKENIAALLFNGKAQGQKVIGEMGDRIWAIQKRVEAAHACYLLSDYQFGPLDNPNSRIVLLGGDHKVSKHYITTESLQRSEIYEYGKTLGNSQYSLPMILVYKFLYATLLCDLGMIEQSSKYINTIKNTLKNHNINNPNFIYQLDTFSERLMNFSSSKMNTSGSWIQLPSIFKFGFGGSKKSNNAPAAVVSTAPVPVVAAVAPVAAQPVKESPVKPAVTKSNSSLKFDDDEDLYSSFSTKTPKKDLSQPPAPTPEGETLDSATGMSQDDDKDKQAGGKSWWFWKKNKSNAKEMLLNDENKFIYDEKLGTWIEKGKPLPKPAEPTPPPPMMDPSPSPNGNYSTPGNSSPPVGMGSPMIPHSSSPHGDVGPNGEESSPLSPGVNKYSLISPNPGGKRRPRYLDTLNQSVYSGSGANLVSSNDGTNSAFKPSMPVPGQFEPSAPMPIEQQQPMATGMPQMMSGSPMGAAPPPMMGVAAPLPMMGSSPMGAAPPPMMGSSPMGAAPPPMMGSSPMGVAPPPMMGAAPPMMSSPPMGAPPMSASIPNFPPTQ